MHRDVPPLVASGRLFSATYVCQRPIDRSALTPLDRPPPAIGVSRFGGRACSVEFFVDAHDYRSTVAGVVGTTLLVGGTEEVQVLLACPSVVRELPTICVY